MPSEDVEVILSANDKMTPAVNKATDNIDAKVKRIREVGERAKRSTEFIGTLASSLGGSELGSYASQLAGLTEKVSAFSEVSKAGAAGSRLFGVGLAAGVGVAAVKAGYELNKYANGMSEVIKQMDKAIERNNELNKSLLATAAKDFDFTMQELDLIGDPQEQEDKVTELIINIEKQIDDARRRLEQKQPKESFDEAWFGDPAMRAKVKQQFEDDQKAIREQIDQLRQQADALRDVTNPRAKNIALLKEEQQQIKRNDEYLTSLEREIELLRAKTDEERISIQARQAIQGDDDIRARVEALMQEKLAIEQKNEAEKLAAAERKRNADEFETALQRINDLRDSELAKLEEQKILLTQGAAAARSYALQQQGLNKETADRIANEQELLNKLSKDVQATPELQAEQGRLLTRGRVDDTAAKQLAKTEEIAKTLRFIDANTKPNKQPPLKLEVVG